MTARGQQGHPLPGPPTSARTGAILQTTGTGKHAVLEAMAMRGVTPLGQQVVGGAGGPAQAAAHPELWSVP